MAFSPAALFKMFRRDPVQDPFGGDDLFDGESYDGESRFAGKGPKIALIASGAMFVALIGGLGYVVATQDPTAASIPVTGSLSGLEIVEDDSEPAAPAAVAAAAQPAPDSTAATDRSASRRPWLAASAPPQDTAAPRLGMTPNQKPSAAPVPPVETKAVETKAAETKIAAVPAAGAKPPEAKMAEAKAPETKAPDVKPSEAKSADAKPADAHAAPETKTTDAKVMDTKAADAKTPDAKETKTAAVMAPPSATTPSAFKVEPAAEEPPAHDPNKDIGGIPALREADQAPGAPRRFDAATGIAAGPPVAGGRPRLVEPPLPPTDKISVSAPPPRYANLTDIKSDAKSEAKKDAKPADNATKIAFIVNSLGLSQSATDAAIDKLPAGVTLAFSPYARNLKKQMERAKAKGHEVLIEVPMESKQFPAEDPGPLGLLTSVEAKENQDRLETILKAAEGATGVLDTMGSKFRESSDYINPFYAKLKQANLFYVQGQPGVRMGEAGVPTATTDVVIDERPFRAAVDARLDYTERVAKYQGSAVASMGAKPVSFERLVLWIEQAQKKGIVLAPISQVLIKQ